ncbi:MAG TPA: 1-deoxy-D-xylulose-5-phosphate reductoisomerase [Candidatus Baltobacteraceae bacterium]
MRSVAILGSTGSIGRQALDVIARHPDRLRVVGLAAGRNRDLLAEQAAAFSPRIATVAADGDDALRRVAAESGADIVLAATDGFVAFDAVMAAVERGIDLAVANKELIVAAGELVMAAAARGGARVIPVDSEHSAIFQCLAGEPLDRVSSIVLTASGGPFRTSSIEQIESATLEQALAHPTWAMGIKNTVDSATLMNKGLEVIEASRLFGLPGDRIEVVVHPQSIAHGMVVFSDGSVKAQLCTPDMRVPIGYALAYPNRLPGPGCDAFSALGGNQTGASLHYDFERPDRQRFPCLDLAYQALARGDTMPAILSAANEVAVAAFVAGKLPLARIPTLVGRVMQTVAAAQVTLETVRAADRAARDRAAELLEEVVCS